MHCNAAASVQVCVNGSRRRDVRRLRRELALRRLAFLDNRGCGPLREHLGCLWNFDSIRNDTLQSSLGFFGSAERRICLATQTAVM